MKVIYMESTLNLMLKSGRGKEVEQIVATGEHRVRESKAGKCVILIR